MNTNAKILIPLVVLVLLAPPGVLADDAHHKSAAAASAGVSELTDGEVRKVDLEAGKVTLKHADIKSLDMPAMTMVFVVKDKAMLEKLKTGDKIRFKAINDGGKFTVTDIRPAP
jgi:Cu/Ag efflux protein CusF